MCKYYINKKDNKHSPEQWIQYKVTGMSFFVCYFGYWRGAYYIFPEKNGRGRL